MLDQNEFPHVTIAAAYDSALIATAPTRSVGAVAAAVAQHFDNQINRRIGDSSSVLSACMYWAARAPSPTRWSHEIVAFMIGAMVICPSFTTGVSAAAPTATIAAWGGVINAIKL